MTKPIRNALISTLALVSTLIVNALANILPLNGYSTGQVSSLYPSLFTPAGITFSIWSIIYLLLIGYICMQWVRRDAYVFAEISRLFWISCLLNSLWIVAWHFLQINISLTLMLLLLLTLSQIFLSVRKISMNSFAEKLLIRLPFTIYFAWICVATIANTSAVLVALQWDALFSPEYWTILMMIVASLLAMFMTIRFRVPPFALVVMWALVGIYLRWDQSEHQIIASAALSLLAPLTFVIVLSWKKLNFKLF